MPSESELREAIRSSANITTTGIDSDAVVRRARARRVPKQLAFSSLSVLAIAGIATLGITTLPSLQPGPDVASESGVMAMVPETSEDAAASGSGAKQSAALQLSSNLCGMPTMSAEPNSADLTLSTNFPELAPADGRSVIGTVVLTNSGTLRVRGSTALQPVVSVARNGITVWHSNSLLNSQAVLIDLDPGQSFSYDAQFTAVECESEDDEGEQFRDNLAPLTPGVYQISAELHFIPDAAVPSNNEPRCPGPQRCGEADHPAAAAQRCRYRSSAAPLGIPKARSKPR